MAQVTGFPGAGMRLSKSVSWFAYTGDPNAATAPKDVAAAGVGSLYSRIDAPDAAHCLYACTVAGSYQTGSAAAVAATWTALT